MNRVFLMSFGFLVTSITGGFAIFASEVALAEEEKVIVGPMSRTELEAHRFAWMESGFKSEKKRLKSADRGSKERLKALATKLEGVDIEAYIASWCSDTHENLPVFLASLDASGAEPKSLRFFALDKRKTYPGFKNELRIERIPTFVFLREGKEIGRFVETPKKTVVEDVLSLLL
jgi:hypothetical protein